MVSQNQGLEKFLLANAARHQTLVQRFKPPPRRNAPQGAGVNPNISVATRIRPILEDEIASGQVIATFPREGDNGILDLHELKRVVRGFPPLNSSSYKVGKVFGADQSTEQIYEDVVLPLLPYTWDGNIGTMFAYGQTGSGKTFTVSALERLIAKSLFDGSMSGERKIHVSMFELADLLNSRTAFSILEDSLGDTQLVGIVEKQITSTLELLNLIDEATSFRKTASTEKNDGSSRSHGMCRIRIENPLTPSAEGGILYLIDLAGSEAARDIFNHTSDRMKETREINISLSILKDCIRGIANLSQPAIKTKLAKAPYIPFRQSMLTKVLKHMFDPSRSRDCRTAVIACVNPSLLDTGATKNTLRYAEMLRESQQTHQPSGYKSSAPKTWGNKELRNYIRLNSGNPSVSPGDLAPSETGAQLLKIPEEEFVRRCLLTDDVGEEQAKDFYAKLWKMHVDSTRIAPAKPA